jgi:hypothetical protein
MPKRGVKKATPKLDPSEQRSLPRKRSLLSAVVVALDGTTASECTIEDINARSAQISYAKSLPIDSQIYLVDASNKAAHLARVVWRRSGRAGLSFIESHRIGLGLPPRLKFLWKAFLETKFKEIYRLVSSGVPIDLALSTAGVTEEHLREMARYGRFEKRFEILLRLASGEEAGARGRYRFNAKAKAWPPSRNP